MQGEGGITVCDLPFMAGFMKGMERGGVGVGSAVDEGTTCARHCSKLLVLEDPGQELIFQPMRKIEASKD